MDEFLIRKLQDLKWCCERQTIAKLKDVAADAAEKAFVRSDKRMIHLVVVAYSIGKLLEKPYIVSTPEWQKFYSGFVGKVDMAEKAAKGGNDEEAYDLLEEMVDDIELFGQSAGRFQTNVIDKAKIKAATQIYAHGGSLRIAASLAGVDLTELSSYIGYTRLPEKYQTMSVKERLKIAEEIFS